MLWRPIGIFLYLTVEAGDTFDFESLRLDWMRLQVKPYICPLQLSIHVVQNRHVGTQNSH